MVATAENIVQSACADALSAYFFSERITYRQLWSYSNQQGEKPNQFCGDLIGVIDNSSILLMEFKSLDHKDKRLNDFKDDQYKTACSMEDAGVPVVYCYDKEEPLEYYNDPRDLDNWPRKTLLGVNASPPSLLFGEYPNIPDHESLLNWIDTIRGQQSTGLMEAFGKALGILLPSRMRNSVVSLIYSKKKNEIFSLSGHDYKALRKWLNEIKVPNDPVLYSKILELKQAVDDGRDIANKVGGKIRPKGPKV